VKKHDRFSHKWIADIKDEALQASFLCNIRMAVNRKIIHLLE
jgi:hypothetical protein